MNKLLIILVFTGFICSACMNSDANLRRETARVIGNLMPDDVTVYDVDRGAMQVDWKAKTPNGVYVCSSDDMMRKPFCKKKKK